MTVKHEFDIFMFPPLFAVDRDRHFGPRILNSQIKSPILTGKLLSWTLFVDVNKRITRATCIMFSSASIVTNVQAKVESALELVPTDSESAAHVSFDVNIFWCMLLIRCVPKSVSI
jgi:hypothetical protein